MSEYVRNFLKLVPGSWDDIQFIDGFPGRFVIIARRSGSRWFVAGINSLKEPRSCDLDLSDMNTTGTGIFITDGETDRSFSRKDVTLNDGKLNLTIKPSGGFVLVLD